MRFRQLTGCAVVFRESTRSTLDGQAQRLQAFVECPTCRVDRRRVFEWRSRLCQDLLQHFGVLFQELSNILRAFLLIAWLTREAEVAYPIGAAVSTWTDMLDL